MSKTKKPEAEPPKKAAPVKHVQHKVTPDPAAAGGIIDEPADGPPAPPEQAAPVPPPPAPVVCFPGS